MPTFTVYDMFGEVLYTGDSSMEANRAFASTNGSGWVDVTGLPVSTNDTSMGEAPADNMADEDDAGMEPDDEGVMDDDSGSDDADDTRPCGMGSVFDDGSDMDDMGDTMASMEASEAAETVAATAPVTVATVMQLSEEGADASMARARNAQLAADLEAALGLAMGPAVYGAGVVLGEQGVNRFHASYDAWAARPMFEDACATVAALVTAENRADHRVHPSRITMNPDGTLTMGPGGAGLRMEETGFKMLLAQVARGTKLRWSRFFGGDDISLVFPRSYQLMAVMPPDLRATVWNRMISDASTGQKLLFRTRQPAGQSMRSLFAVASESYGVYDADRVLSLLGRVLAGSGARGSVVYEPRSTNLYANASWHADRVFDVASGDVMGLSVSFRSNDARAGSIVAFASAECGFGRMTFGKELARVRHTGAGVTVRASQELHAAVGKARVAFDAFLSDWGHMAVPVIKVRLYGDTHATAAMLLDAMVESGNLPVPNMTNEAVKAMVLRAFHSDPGETLTHVARALTRAAQSSGLDAEQQDTMERAAGAFVQLAARAATGKAV